MPRRWRWRGPRTRRGERYKAIASTLGLRPDTLMRWCRAGREPKKFARVVVKRTAAPRLTVHSPAGTRIEELSIEQVVELLRMLAIDSMDG